MASQQIIDDQREGAEVYGGDSALCKVKSVELLEEIKMPRGLLPLDDIEEVGYNRTTGFVWLTQKKGKEHRFKSIGKSVYYDANVTAFVEERKMRRLTGVKSKELLIWVSISDIFVPSKDPSTIGFATGVGLARTFPVSAFQREGEDGDGDGDGEAKE